MSAVLLPLEPSAFRRVPWKNGGGVSVNIAQELLPGARQDGWDDVIWRLGATSILEDGPFSDLSGYDRLQAVISGSGMMLETPSGEIDLRAPLVVRRYPGEGPISCRLRDGPVEVLNLIGDRMLVSLDLRLVRPGPAGYIQPGQHVLWAFQDNAVAHVAGGAAHVDSGHALRIETEKATRFGVSGAVCWLASIMPR